MNRQTFAYLKENSRFDRALDAYESRTHPDLVGLLYELLEDLIRSGDVRKGSAFGRPVLANQRGLVFAWAGGTHSIFFRLTMGGWHPLYFFQTD
jgi:hypothetical protein